MPPGLRDPGDPAEWLRRARSNLTRAARDRDEYERALGMAEKLVRWVEGQL